MILVRLLLVTAHCLLFVARVEAQQAPLEADRPDQTETPAIVPTGWYQFEGGYAREWSGHGSAFAETAPTVLSKLGLARWAELRLITEWTALHPMVSNESAGSGVLPVEVGAKFRLLEERGLRPCISLLGHVGLPFLSSNAFRTRSTFGNFRFTLQHTLSDRFSLGYNLGAEWDGYRSTASGVYTLTVASQATTKLSVFVEAYGFVNDMDAADHRLDGGLTLRIGPDVLLDTSSGFSLGERCWFVSLGLSFRVPVFVRRTVASG